MDFLRGPYSNYSSRAQDTVFIWNPMSTLNVHLLSIILTVAYINMSLRVQHTYKQGIWCFDIMEYTLYSWVLGPSGQGSYILALRLNETVISEDIICRILMLMWLIGPLA